MQGVILAAGESTRMPGKAWLPVRLGDQHVPAIEYQVVWLMQRGCDRIKIVVAPRSPLVEMVYMTCMTKSTKDRIKFIDQPEPLGVDDAISRGCGHEWSLVVAVDNIIPIDENVNWRHEDMVTSRMLPDKVTENLDVFTSAGLKRGWTGYRSLTYPIIKKAGIPLYTHGSTKVDHKDHVGWHDIGTPDTYFRYVKEVMRNAAKKQ